MNIALRVAVPAALLVTALLLVPFAREVRSEDAKTKRKAPFVQNATDSIKLREGHRNATKVKLGRDISGEGRIYITDWFGAKAVSGQVAVENKTDKKLYTSVSFILLDKAGVPLACAAQAMDIDPKESTNWGGFVVKLPAAQLARVASYRYIWYEDTQAIGTR